MVTPTIFNWVEIKPVTWIAELLFPFTSLFMSLNTFRLLSKFYSDIYTESKCCHFDDIFIIGCTGSFDNFRCSQWWKFRKKNDISFSVSLFYLIVFSWAPPFPMPRPWRKYGVERIILTLHGRWQTSPKPHQNEFYNTRLHYHGQMPGYRTAEQIHGHSKLMQNKVNVSVDSTKIDIFWRVNGKECIPYLNRSK